MKIMTVLGTRPEIIRLSLVIPLLDEYAEHTLVHTGQNFDTSLSDIFFDELGVRDADIHLNVRSESFGQQIGSILGSAERLFRDHRPDRLLILGDTNSALVSIVARRLGIPVYHMEAGNRCFDDRVPEEVNRRVIDHCSSILLPYTERSKANLVREGFREDQMYVTGNPIGQVIAHYQESIDASSVISDLGLSELGYFLVTAHRAENVDFPRRLAKLLSALDAIRKIYDKRIIVSTHPRTRSQAQLHGLELNMNGIDFLDPLGFFDFVRLEKSAACVLTDSGTVQEEACILKTPSVTIRDATERPETLDVGANILSGGETDAIVAAARTALTLPTTWVPPREYRAQHVAETVVRLVLGFRMAGRAELNWQDSRGAS